MGACFSLSQQSPPPPTAKVVSINGALRYYNVPVPVYLVLHSELANSSSSSSTSSILLCNSDSLTYDDPIPELDSNAHLSANHLYFVLPRSKLQNRLSASDMAALAVKASLAIQNASKKDGRRKKKARISPVYPPLNQSPSQDDGNVIKSFEKPKQEQPTPQYSRSASVRRLHKYTSRRAKLAVRSFRLRLTTIYEGTVL